MNCPFCGKTILDGSKFCNYCGASISESSTLDSSECGSLKIIRENAFPAHDFKTKVFIDGNLVASIKNDSSYVLSLTPGIHVVDLRTTNFGQTTKNIEIFPNVQTTYEFRMVMFEPEKHKTVGIFSSETATHIPPKTTMESPSLSVQQPKNVLLSNAKPKKKLTWLVWVIAAIVLFGLLKPYFLSNTTTEEQATSPNSTPTTTQPVVYEIGETATFNHLEFTITGYSFSRYYGGLSGANQASPDDVYLVVYIDVHNPTNEEAIITKDALGGGKYGYYHFQLLYDGEYEYNSSFMEYSDFLLANEKILPLGSLSGKILNYQIPVIIQDSDKPLTVTISGDYSSEGTPVTFRLR